MCASADYETFRQQLDTILRQRDAPLLRTFLVSSGQWEDTSTVDIEAAMWMMIATSPALQESHREARDWLIANGHEAEAQAIFGTRKQKSVRRTSGTNQTPKTGSKPRTRSPGKKQADASAAKESSRTHTTRGRPTSSTRDRRDVQ